MRDPFRPIATNLTPVNVIGVPGLALVVIAIALAVQFPEARWLIADGLLGGAAIAMALIHRRSRLPSDDNDRWSHGLLGVNHDDSNRLGSRESDRARADRGRGRSARGDRMGAVPALTLPASV